ncbi:hypothetical protein BDN72DRAFT_834443 [Pluteus cervinus]|uniref:Uncharacterized protein n=1 Tax=Pluteus cervinus TaxID=181527 RepID=A0ACD3B6W1_9AGAR|nr:hypothetical protein BDN72DRAFT_834443 [Pluteus cervinus]
MIGLNSLSNFLPSDHYLLEVVLLSTLDVRLYVLYPFCMSWIWTERPPYARRHAVVYPRKGTISRI